MTDAEILQKIKYGLGITGTFLDETLKVYITDTKEFMRSAGVKESVVNSAASVGCILQGVTDKWAEKRTDYSEAFKKRLIQLSLKPELLTEDDNNAV
ncbi:MAG: hypothetical protein MJ072_04945 [Clostridia bacterium]|nr:hypothetical protein [Clostridia bacterium]